ncbi:hypothetical protein LR48_Vigan03g126000 [Vigna angularis]|uniref:Uncharacterized protein n=1 Tax=Phaseolus angularis TaxID=3914 RepID=A0A0L9U4X6_PHAAN|nr:hypothetical protein LR48_Vigan03g126000 [Vigna angularis]
MMLSPNPKLRWKTSEKVSERKIFSKGCGTSCKDPLKKYVGVCMQRRETKAQLRV